MSRGSRWHARHPSAPGGMIGFVICPMTGGEHRLFWMRSAWWCEDCRQKVESCCEGGGCPSVFEVARSGRTEGDRPNGPPLDSPGWSSHRDNGAR